MQDPLLEHVCLLLANQGKGDTEIAKTLGVGRSTALRIRKRYLKEGLQSILVDNLQVNLKNIMKGMLPK